MEGSSDEGGDKQDSFAGRGGGNSHTTVTSLYVAFRVTLQMIKWCFLRAEFLRGWCAAVKDVRGEYNPQRYMQNATSKVSTDSKCLQTVQKNYHCVTCLSMPGAIHNNTTCMICLSMPEAIHNDTTSARLPVGYCAPAHNYPYKSSSLTCCRNA
eukprot:1157531-Pelagomonas_calceolata.AAC.4